METQMIEYRELKVGDKFRFAELGPVCITIYTPHSNDNYCVLSGPLAGELFQARWETLVYKLLPDAA